MSSLRCAVIAVLLAGCTADVAVYQVPDDSEADPDATQVDQVAELFQTQDGVTVTPDTAGTGDRDHDGIPDETEELLLRRYRPYYRFSQNGDGQDESYRPANPVAELEHAQLRIAKPGGDGLTDPVAGCGRAGDHHLDPAESLYSCRPDASFEVAQARTTYALNLDNSRYAGVSFADAEANATGLYGHVAPTTIGGHDAYKIEYWQFFAFNNQDITLLGQGSFGDHEGDWTSVQLWFDKVAKRLVKVRYLIHGKAATFDIPAVTPACKACTIAMQGPNYNPDPPNFLAHPEAYSNNQAEFYIDDHHYKHVVVYIERGSHEFWPGAWGHASVSVGPLTFHLNSHNGAGPSYLVPDVPDRVLDLGEVGHPITRAGKIILPFDGQWGSTNTHEAGFWGPIRQSPVGPAMHCSWRWPDRGPIARCSG